MQIPIHLFLILIQFQECCFAYQNSMFFQTPEQQRYSLRSRFFEQFLVMMIFLLYEL